MSPTPRVAAVIVALALGALVVPVGIVLIAAAVLLGAVIADAAFVRSRPVFRRDAPELLSRGVPEPIEIDVDVPPARASTVRQATPADLELSPSTGSSPLQGEITASRRGRHTLPAAAARVTGPLGLASWQHSGSEGGAEVLVYPDLPAARRVALAARRSRYRDPGRRGRGPLGLGTEFESVRDYSPDDDIRQVNWRATARLGRPMSNDFRIEQDRDVIALIDCGRLMSAPLGSLTRLDAALDAMTALAAVADDVGDRFGAFAFDSGIRRELRPRRAGGALCVRELFDLEPSSVDSDYRLAFESAKRAKRAFVIVFTDLVDEVAARSLVESVPLLARRHAVVVASVADPDLEAITATRPARSLDVYRAAVAIDVLDGRRRIAARLRHAGAEVIEASPGGLGARCVDSYMQAKSRARL